MPSGSHHDQQIESVACAVITVSDTRTEDTDRSGALIRSALEGAGHAVVTYEIIPDEPALVCGRVRQLCRSDSCAAVILTGGTGIARRDSTSEAVDAIFEKKLPGFGELFRLLSYDQIGAAAMLSRASAGVCNETVVFSMPGSTAAVQLAIEKLILPELGHIAWLLQS